MKIKIEVFPYREKKLNETYVTIRATLLTDIEHCYGSSLRFSILTVNKEIKEKIRDAHNWRDILVSFKIIPWTSYFLISRNVSDSMLVSGNLNILSELHCMRASELKSTQSEVSSPANLVEMTYVWNICNLANFPSLASLKILSSQFPSNSDLGRFFLLLDIETIHSSFSGRGGLFNCVIDSYIKRLTLIINQTFTLRDFRNVKYYGPSSYLYISNENCQGKINVYLYGLLNRQCFKMEYQGVYAVDIKPQ